MILIELDGTPDCYISASIQLTLTLNKIKNTLAKCQLSIKFLVIHMGNNFKWRVNFDSCFECQFVYFCLYLISGVLTRYV